MHRRRQEQAKITRITTSLGKDTQYPHWHCQPQCKTPGPDVPRPYAAPKETDTASRDATLSNELGLDDVYDPMVSRTGVSTPGPHTPPAYAEDTTPIPHITLPTSGGSRDSGFGGLASGMASPVTNHDYRLLNGLPPSLRMDIGISQAPGSGQGSSHETPMLPSLPAEAAPSLTAFTDAMKQMQEKAKRKQQEEELPYPAYNEEEPDWM